MKKVLVLLISLFTFTVFTTFNLVEIKRSTESFSSKVESLTNDYSVVSVIGKVNWEEMSNKFDIIALDNNTIYLPKGTSINNLYGSYKDCVVPFSSDKNSCGFFTFYKKNLYEFASMDDIKTDSNNLQYLVKNDEVEGFQNSLLKSGYTKEQIFFSKLDSGYNQSQKTIDFNEIIVLMGIIITLITILDVVKNHRYYRILMINGDSAEKIFITKILSKFVVALILVVIIQSIIATYFYISYNSLYLVKIYLSFATVKFVYLFMILLLVSLSTFMIMFVTNVQNLLKFKKLHLSATILLVAVYLFSVIYVIFTYPINEGYEMVLNENYNQYMKVLEKKDVYQKEIRDLFDSNWSAKELEELNVIRNNHPYVVIDFYTSTQYLSTDYASKLFNTQIPKGTYYLNKKCGTDGYEVFVIDNIFINNSSYSENEDNFNSCYIITSNPSIVDGDILENGDLIVIADNLNSPIFQNQGTIGNYSYYDTILFIEGLLYFILILLTILVMTLILPIMYISFFTKREFQYYINGKRYIFMQRYIILKLVLNIIIMLVMLVLVNLSSLIYLILIIGIDCTIYIILRNKYILNLQRFNKLSGGLL
ncbi:MAG: hypothetical protein ACK5NF_07550 [Bacilli bacterium]